MDVSQISVSLVALLSVVSIVFSIYFGLKNSKKSDNSEIEKRVEDSTRLNTKLDMISQNTNDIKAEMRNMNARIEEHNEKIIILEQSCKSAHKRLDDFSERLGRAEQHE